MPVEHYENFPVASILLPARLRRPIETIYAFARSADDFADEGTLPDHVRIAQLTAYDDQLSLIGAGAASTHPLFIRLAAEISAHHLPLRLFHDLLDAFKQDVTKTRYANFAELMDYCRRSANPIGRLLLILNQQTSAQQLAWSDAICSALQLINHWQDVAVDWKKNSSGRVYLPQDDLAQFGLTDADIATGVNSDAWVAMMAFQCKRARELMLSGAPLAQMLRGRFGIELRLIVGGGLAVLDKIDAVRGDVFHHRPQLTKWDWLRIVPRALF